MFLMPAYFSTTSTKKRKQAGKTQRQREADAEHNRWLAKRGLLNLQPTKLHNKLPNYKIDSKGVAPTSDVIPAGVAPKAEAKMYDGEQTLLGIATMHKSNMVPVFSKKDAEDISKMRRG